LGGAFYYGIANGVNLLALPTVFARARESLGTTQMELLRPPMIPTINVEEAVFW
jgi:hypothetical protein